MRRTIFAVLSTFAILSCSNHTTNMPQEPQAKRVPVQLEKHGDIRIDNYYWLNQREDEEVIEYLNSENAYREAIMKGTEELQSSLYDEMVGRIKQDDSSVPYELDGYFYYSRFNKGDQYPIYCRKKGSMDADEEILLNVNELAKGHSYYQVSGISVRPDSKMIAFGVDTVSRRIYTIHFKDLETGEILEEVIPNTSGSATWAEDSKTVFYCTKDRETLRQDRVHRHVLGTNYGVDVEVYYEEDDTYITFVGKSKSKKFILIGSHSTLTTEYRFIPADQPDSDFTVIQPRTRGLEYGVAHFEDYWYIRTNHNGATNFKLMKTPIDAPGVENWVDVIPHREDVLLEGVEIFRDFLVVDERSNGLNQIHIQRWDGSEEHYIEFDEETYTAYVGNNPQYDTELLRYGYSSMTTPASVIEYNMTSRDKVVLKEQEVVGGYDKSQYKSERVWATADDGTKVPISLVYRVDMKREGGNPLLLYGYGSYGHTIDPSFSSTRLSLLDRGFVYAIAHVRGGEYLGRPWYEDGKLLNKRNTFTDFIACGDFLIESGMTSKGHLYAMGGSAGGLLMGAVINMRPSLFNGVIAAVPFVDVMTTMLDESIPLTTGEYDEWGNPNEKEYYDYMLSYSPYDNVETKDYPALLITTGLHDSQVQYWEPAKWIAKLREKRTNRDRPLLMYCNMDTGHGGASGRFEAYKEVAMEYAFFLDLEGISK
ncbi:MAG: S9 family peptidase [Bacteroidetes bacterium]|nr:MAG: S9 family peptidase [Bacteroidota bacterium]